MVSDVDGTWFPQLSGSNPRFEALFSIPRICLVPLPVTDDQLVGHLGRCYANRQGMRFGQLGEHRTTACIYMPTSAKDFPVYT